MTYMDDQRMRTEKELRNVSKAVASGLSPTEAINRNATTGHSYSEALKAYGLKPTSNDYD